MQGLKLLVTGALLVAAAVGAAPAKEGASDAERALPFLHAAGTAIADEKDQPVVLRGTNLGNWLLLEPWMLGIYDRAEVRDQAGIERALVRRFGAPERDRFLELYRENWITARDFDLLRAWRFNVVRLPFHHALLEDDAHPGELRPDAFRWLDRAVDLARAAGIYVILDLHGAPGGQSLDGVTGEAGRNRFWQPENRRRGAWLWQRIAEHFRDEPTVAAYDLLNEPYGTMSSDNHDADLVGAMDEMIRAIRQVDERHLIFCAGSLRGIEAYGPPEARGWKNVGYTEHFYPGVYGGTSTLETHARFLGSNLAARAELLKTWHAPYFAGEFNVVFDHAGGADMMRRYYDEFARHGWAATSWAYKLLNRDGGISPDHWYTVTNARPLTPPDFLHDSAESLENFCRALGTMDLAQIDGLRDTLNAPVAPDLILGKYAPVVLPAQRPTLRGWTDTDVGDAFPRGGHLVENDTVQVFGGGRDVYEGNDEYHFVSRPAQGDFSVRAEVTRPTDTHEFAKAGLMFRASRAADAPFVMINVFPDGSCVAAYRDQPGKRFTVTTLRLDPGTAALCLARRGAVFTLEASGANGAPLAARTFDLPGFTDRGELGLFVLSHDAMQLAEATFSHLRVEASAPTHLTKTP